MNRLTIQGLQSNIGVKVDGSFGPKSRAALLAKLTNANAPRLTDADYERAAKRLGVPVGHIRGVRSVEAPRGPFDKQGRPTILYERHKFRNNTVPPGRYNDTYPALSGPAFGPGGYGLLSVQYDRFLDACALDPEAAFNACSWGAFQVMGENAQRLGYPNSYDMATGLVASEAAHLETFLRYVEGFNLVTKLQACRPNDAASCVPFVKGYNGVAYEKFNYHRVFAKAIAIVG